MKRVFAFLLCGALMLPHALAAAPDSWPDWAQEALLWGEQAALSQSFLTQPNEVVTRGMAAQVLYEAADRPAAGSCPFTDVPQAYAQAAAWAAEQGYITGVGDGPPGRAVALL